MSKMQTFELVFRTNESVSNTLTIHTDLTSEQIYIANENISVFNFGPFATYDQVSPDVLNMLHAIDALYELIQLEHIYIADGEEFDHKDEYYEWVNSIVDDFTNARLYFGSVFGYFETYIVILKSMFPDNIIAYPKLDGIIQVTI
jgi:hypothetical protein